MTQPRAGAQATSAASPAVGLVAIAAAYFALFWPPLTAAAIVVYVGAVAIALTWVVRGPRRTPLRYLGAGLAVFPLVLVPLAVLISGLA